MAMIPYFTRLKYAFRTFFSILDYGRVPGDVAGALGLNPAGTSGAGTIGDSPAVAAPPAGGPAPVPPAVLPQPDETRAAQMLALLQRDGRLIDFLMEDLSAYADAQVGAAVRGVHANTRLALQKYVTLEPVVVEDEGALVTVEPGTDPAMVKVIGPAAGQPPFQGIVRHRGWMVSRLNLPAAPRAAQLVVAPAEVEVQ